MTASRASRVTALVEYAAVFAAHAPVDGSSTACTCGRTFGSHLGRGNHLRAAVRRAEASLSVEQSRILDDLRAEHRFAPARWYAERAVIVERAAALDALPTDDEVEALLDEVEARADAEHAADEVSRELDAVEPATAEAVADAILDRRPILDLFPSRDLTREQCEVVDAGVTVATERLAARYGTTPAEVIRLGREVVEETLTPVEPPRVVTVEQLVHDTIRLGYATVPDYLGAPGRNLGQVTPWTLDRAIRAHRREVARLARVVEPGPEVDDPREQPRPLDWSEVVAPAPVLHVRTNADEGLPLCGEAGPLVWTAAEATCPTCLRDSVARYEGHAKFLRAMRPDAWQAAEEDEAAATSLRIRLRQLDA
jgi:hypothetical protein